MKRRRQCAKCPWKTSTDPHGIPDGYCEQKHAGLERTIADPGSLAGVNAPIHVMACHETEDIPCIGWLDHQLNEGNNIGLRMRVASGKISADYELVGEQHKRFEDTLP